MGTDATRRTPRDMPPGTFFAKEIVPPVRKLLEQQGAGPAVQELTRLVDSNRRKFGLAIDKELSAWLRQRQASDVSQKHINEDEIRARARDLLLREVEPLFSCALGLDQSAFCEQLLKTIVGVQAFGAYGYQAESARASPRNPVAYFWAVLEAYKSGKPVSEYLDEDVAVYENYKRQTKCAIRLILFARQTVQESAPGYTQVQKLRMSEQEVAPVADLQLLDPMKIALRVPVPIHDSEAPTQEMKVRKVELVFEGPDAVADYELFERAAKSRGGVVGFIRQLAAGLRNQGKK